MEETKLLIDNIKDSFQSNRKETIQINETLDHISLQKGEVGEYYKNKYPAELISLDRVAEFNQLFISVHAFIQNGYRVNYNIKDCLKSIFAWHNETLNIWTHLLAFLAFASLFIYLLANSALMPNTSSIIYLYLFSSCLLFLFSTVYHIFSCHSQHVCGCCYKLDLTGIMFQLMVATVSSIHFMFHEFDVIRETYITLFLTLGIFTMLFSSFDFFISAKFNLLLIGLYASLFVISFMSAFHWACVADIMELKQISVYVVGGFLFMIIGFLFFLSKFPECVFQNKFIDYFCHSHIIWHTFCVLAVACYYLMMVNYSKLIEDKMKSK